MPKKSYLVPMALLLAAPLFSQGLSSFLPAKVAPKASRLLASIDDFSSAISAKRNGSREAQLKAEAEAVESYALIRSSSSSRSAWAKPDGSVTAADAPAAYEGARARAKAAALALASGEDPKAEAAREAAADSLSALILSSGISGKAAAGLDALLAGKAKDLGRLFPEALELGAQLRKSGAAGAREAAAASARREAESIARSLIASKPRLLVLSPASAASLAGLEAAWSAYRAWSAAFPIAAYPGDLGLASDEARAALAAGISALTSLGQARASALVSAMQAGGARDLAAAASARRLAEVWARSPAARRRSLAALCGSSESAMAEFASGIAPGGEGASIPGATSGPLRSIGALNALEIAIADEESSGGAASGPEPALLFLERPELGAVAKGEPRYADLFAEATRRIDALYAQAAEGAQLRLEASPQVAKAAALALGSPPAGIVVRSIDLVPTRDYFERRLAFFATATDSSGQSISFPLRADLASMEYAAAFALAAGLGSAKAEPAKKPSPELLTKYGQVTVSAYDPEGSRDGFAVDAYPRSASMRLLNATDLEIALLGAWHP